MSKTIIVSNRLPVKVTRQGEDYSITPSEGGLATGLGSIYKQDDNIWIGWPGIEVADETGRNNVTAQLKEESLLPVFLSQDEINGYYEGFSNEVLWPVFHYYASTYANYKEADWDCYNEVNQKFRDAVLEVLDHGDTIWIHDYQLLLLPQLIRRQMPDVAIGFFLHIPFPSYEMFRLIPWRNQLLEGMLGADLIGFHTFDDVRHFLSAATRLLPVSASSNLITQGERSTIIDSFPMGIDDQKYASLPAQPQVQREIQLVRETFKDTKIILSVDRLDYSKGILQRLEAFELFLKRNSEYKGKLVFYMIVVPSRDTVPQYAQLKDRIDKKVGNINSLYRDINWTPIHYYYRSMPIETLSALYYSADVCLVTPMRDGMNLVSKEFVASRVDNDGVLILSEMAGASKELIDAIIVNPNNTSEIADAISQAINLPPDEQGRRMEAMRQVVAKFNISHWVKLFMQGLKQAKHHQRSMQTRHVGGATAQSIVNRYSHTGKRLIFLDYDGTLVGFKTRIEEASPDAELYDLLSSLAADADNRLVLISGRKYQNLGEWFGHLPVTLVAEHGAWVKHTDEEWSKVAGLNDAWKHEVYPVMQNFVDRTPGSFIEEKTYSLVWHYRKAQKELGELRANELVNTLEILAADKGLKILPGNKVLELKNVEVNKGKAALTLLENSHPDLIIAIGDDHTDEDLFKMLPDSTITIKVGSTVSAAKFYLRNPTEVRGLLSALIQHQHLDA